MQNQLIRYTTLWVAFLGGYSQLFAQNTFFKQLDFNHNPEAGVSILRTNDGYILVGEASTPNRPLGGTVDIAKVDWNGGNVWYEAHGQIAISWGAGLAGGFIETSDGNYLLAGVKGDTIEGSWDSFAMKFDKYGDTIWTKVYDYPRFDVLHRCIETSDSNYLFIGYLSDPSLNYQLRLLKTDQEGNLLWDKEFGGIGDDIGEAIDETPEGGFIVSGGKSQLSGATDGWILKVDKDGNYLWDETYGTIRDDCGMQAIHSGNHRMLAYHCIDTLVTPSSYYATYYFTKLYPDGSIAWRTFFDSEEIIILSNLRLLPDGTSIILGTIRETLSDSPRTWLAKVDADGNKLWTREYAFVSTNRASDFVMAPDGGIMIIGTCSGIPGNGGSDFMLLKLDSMGCFTVGCDTVTSIETIYPERGGIRVFPNPIQSDFHIEGYSPLSQDAHLSIHDYTGKLMHEEQLTTRGKFDLNIPAEHWGKGVYVVSLWIEGERVSSQKVVK